MSKQSFKGLVEEAKKNADYWQERQETFEELSDLVDYLYESINDIYNECLDELAAAEGDVIEHIRIRAYRAIKKVKGEQDGR